MHSMCKRGSPEGDATHAILDSLRRIVRMLREIEGAGGPRGVTPAQLFVLHALRSGPAGSVNELAERTYTHQSTVSVVAARLVGMGLVARTRSSRDARRVELSLTPAGRRVLGRAPAVPQQRLVDGIARLSRAERAQLAHAIARLVESLGLDRTAPPMFYEDETPPRPGAGARSSARSARKRPRAQRAFDLDRGAAGVGRTARGSREGLPRK